MLIAHLPSGYLLGAALDRRAPGAPGVIAAAMVGSVLPDIDMLYFHMVDSSRHHHDFFTHWPLFWLAACAVVVPLAAWRAAAWLPAAVAFFAGAMLHMALDSVAAPIMWLAPFSEAAVELVRVPAAYSHWIVSFVLHWTFLLELAICALAAAVWLGRRRARRKRGTQLL